MRLLTLLLIPLLAGCPAEGPPPDTSNNAAPNNVAPNNVAPNNVAPNNVVANNVATNNLANVGLSVVVQFERVEWGLREPAGQTAAVLGESRGDGYVDVDVDLAAGAWAIQVLADDGIVINTADAGTDRLIPMRGDVSDAQFFNPARATVTFRVRDVPSWSVEVQPRAQVEPVRLDGLDVATAAGPWFDEGFEAVIGSDDPGGAVVELMHQIRQYGGPIATDAGVLFIAPAQDGEPAPQIRGTWNSFDADPASELRRITPGFWARFIELPPGRHEYKIYYPGGDTWVADISNRHINWDGFDTGTIGAFNSVLSPSGARTVYLPAMYSPQLQNERDVYVHLPAGYDDSGEAYPVLYVQDGNESIIRGQFHIIANETAAADARTATILTFIALPDQNFRIDEYTMGTAGSWGDGYVDFLAETLVGQIDQSFRTRTDRAARGVNGASLGGLVSFWSSMQHPNVFGYAAGMSSTFFWGDDFVIDELGARGCQGITYYLDSGSPNDNFDVTRTMRDTLDGLGCDYDYVLEPNGQHDWAFWRGRFGGVLTDFADVHGG